MLLVDTRTDMDLEALHGLKAIDVKRI
jgi:hypothetical protein